MKKCAISMLAALLSVATAFSVAGCDQKTDDLQSSIGKENAVALSSVEKQAVYSGTYGEEAENGNCTYYGVGRTLNVITDPFITVSSGYSKIFDTNKLLGMNWHKTKRGEMASSTISGNSMEELYSNMTADFNINFGVGVDFGVFSASLEGKFGNFAGISYRQTANEIYFSASQTYAATLIEIDEYYDLSQFKEVLSEEVLEDATAVQSGVFSPDQFIYKYGTHVVLAGYYGGRVDANYYLQNLGKQWDSSTGIEYQLGIQSSILKLISANAEAECSIKEELGITSNSVTEQFTASSIGGDNFSALSLEDFLNGYKAWATSMNDTTEYSNLVDLPARSLAAIWDLFPAEYSEASNILNEYFENEAKSVSNEFLSKYEKYYTEPIDEGDTVRFDGGLGTQDSPYLIATKEHFENIKSTNWNAYFKLQNSIDLGVWNAPFEFKGHLDGNGYTLSYYQTVASSGNVYGGLFTVLNDAEVRNLYIDFNIGDLKGDTTARIGGLAGKTVGNVKIANIASSGSIIASDGVGDDYLGGIIGYFSGGTIDQCYNSAQIESHAWNARAGGIAGCAYAKEMPIKISNCYNVGDIRAYTAYIWGGRSAGGIVGQVRGNKAFTLQVTDCYNDSVVETIQEKNAALGWWGCGGLIGDIHNKESDNINIERCYWNSTKCEVYGNNASLHNTSGAKTDMNGSYPEWSEDVWSFNNSSAPELKWMISNFKSKDFFIPLMNNY